MSCVCGGSLTNGSTTGKRILSTWDGKSSRESDHSCDASSTQYGLSLIGIGERIKAKYLCVDRFS